MDCPERVHDMVMTDLLTDQGFARRVEAELDALGYPHDHVLREAARTRFNTHNSEEENHG